MRSIGLTWLHRLLLHGAFKVDDIQDAFEEYGCNMRTLKAVLLAKEDAEVKEIIRQRINQLSLSDVHGMIDADTEVSSHASHSIITSLCLDQPTPDEERYERSDRVHRYVSSPAVWEALNDRHGELLYSEIKLTTGLSQRALETSPMAGYLWEAYCHARISAGGVFTLIPMAVRGTNLVPCHTMPKPITIGHLTRTKFGPGDPAASTQEDTKYYIPSASNNAIFNAFLFSKSKQIALQTTISSSHSLSPRALEGLDKRLPQGYKQCFTFVVPRSTAQTFTCKLPTDPAWPGVKFFLLLLDHGNSKYYPSSARMWKLTSLAAPLAVGPESDVNATSENEDRFVEINDEMTEFGTPVYAGSQSAYSWCYHLLSSYQSAGERTRIGMRMRMRMHQAPQTLRNLGRRRQGENRTQKTRRRSAKQPGRRRRRGRGRGKRRSGQVIKC